MMTHMSQPIQQRIPQLTLGWRLKMALGEMSAQGMADALGVSRATVSRWMADKGAPPKAAYVKQWALMTAVPYVWIATGTASDPDGGDMCAIRDSNPEPADYQYRPRLALVA